MFNLSNINSLIRIILLFLTYIPSVTIAGSFQAFVAYLMGDSTAKDSGFLSFNPLKFVSAYGLIALVTLGLGWKEPVPINTYNIHDPSRNFKIALVYYSESFAYAFLSIFSIFILGVISHFYEYSYIYGSYIETLTYIAQSFMFFNAFIAVLSFLIETLRLILLFKSEKHPTTSNNQDLIMLIGSFAILFFVIYVLYTPIIYALIGISHYINQFIKYIF